MAGDVVNFGKDLVEKTTRVTRIRLDAVHSGSQKKPDAGRAA